MSCSSHPTRVRSTRADHGSPPRSPRSCWRWSSLTAPSTFATVLLGVQAALFALGAALGVQRTPHAWVFRTLIRPRLAPPTELEDAAPPRFAQAVGLGLRGGRPGRLRRRPATCSAWSPPGSPWWPHCSTPSSGFCLGCEMYLLIRRLRPVQPPATVETTDRHHQLKGTTHDPRELSRHRPVGGGQPRHPRHRPDRGRRGHHRLRQGPHPGRDQARLDDRPAGPGPPRLREQGAVRGAAVRARRRQRRHRRALRRQQQLVRGLRLLVLQAVRPPGRQAARRRPQEVGARLPRADRRAARRASARRTPRRSRTTRSARSATRRSPRSASRTWSTCAAPTSSPAGCSPRPTCRRSRRSARATSRPRPTCRGARRPTTTAPSSPTTSSRRSTPRPASTGARTPSPTAGSASAPRTPGSCCSELLGQQNVKNYDGSWTEYGSLVGVPIALGDEPGEA